MLPYLTTPILNCFYHLLWFYFSTDSEFSCLAMLAKPHPVSGLTPLLQIPNRLHCIQKSSHEVLGAIFGDLSHASFHIKSPILFINHWGIVFRSTFVYLQPPLATRVLIVEGLILI